jgi:hypothetical protein
MYTLHCTYIYENSLKSIYKTYIMHGAENVENIYIQTWGVTAKSTDISSSRESTAYTEQLT